MSQDTEALELDETWGALKKRVDGQAILFGSLRRWLFLALAANLISLIFIVLLFFKPSATTEEVVQAKHNAVDKNDEGVESPPKLYGYISPIPGALPVPFDDNLVVGAERPYRGGIHQGIDIFYYDKPHKRKVAFGDSVVAMTDAVVVRADRDYRERDGKDRETLLLAAKILGGKAGNILDALRGRQVWLQSYDGVIIRYAHLATVADKIVEGKRVQKGRFIGFVGNSGTSEGVLDTQSGVHLHYEIWPNGHDYLGEGLPIEEARRLYHRLFEPYDDLP